MESVNEQMFHRETNGQPELPRVVVDSCQDGFCKSR